jgi:hypothetical protein
MVPHRRKGQRRVQHRNTLCGVIADRSRRSNITNELDLNDGKKILLSELHSLNPNKVALVATKPIIKWTALWCLGILEARIGANAATADYPTVILEKLRHSGVCLYGVRDRVDPAGQR